MLINTQPAEPLASQADGNTLAVNSIFYTIQGEGPFAGSPAVFIRLAGCNLQCPMCDTEYVKRRIMSVDMIVVDYFRHAEPVVAIGKAAYFPLVVITGGEPFRQNIEPLVRALILSGLRVQIETNGTLPPSAGMLLGNKALTIVCSPKSGSINKKLEPWIDAYKYVANVQSLEGSVDGLPSHALEHPNGKGLARPGNPNTPVYLQPVDEQNKVLNKRNTKAVVESCLKYGHRLCLQMHKIVGVD